MKERSKVESWYICIVNAFTILAYLYGRKLYAVSGPLIFWAVLSLFVTSAGITLIFYREPKELTVSAGTPKSSILGQIVSIFKEAPPHYSHNIVFFLTSVSLYGLALGSSLGFSPSWVVVTLGVNESKAAGIMVVMWVAATLFPIPAGYLGATKFGRRNLYLLGLLITLGASLVLFIAPRLYPVGLAALGAGLSITLTVQLPLASEVAYDKKALGTMVGVYNFAYMLGVLLGANCVGLLIQLTSYRALFPAVGVCSLLAAFLALFIHPGRGTEDMVGRSG